MRNLDERKKLVKINISNRRMIILAAVSIFLTIAMVFGYQIDNYSMIYVRQITVITLLGGIIMTFIGLCIIFYLFDLIKVKHNFEKEFSKWKIFCLYLEL